MAIKIKKELTDQSGAKVAAGSIVEFEVGIQRRGKSLTVAFYVFPSQAGADADKNQFTPKEFPRFSFVQKLTDADRQNLSNASIHVIVKTWMENNCEGLAAADIEIVN